MSEHDVSAAVDGPAERTDTSMLEPIRFEPQRSAAAELVDEFLATGRVDGILLDGSFARGEPRADSDLDFYLLLKDDEHQVDYPHRFELKGVQVDLTQHGEQTIVDRIVERPMRVYRHLYGKILVDQHGGLRRVEDFARSFIVGYRTSDDVVLRLLPTLEGLRNKMRALAETADETHVGWSATWGSWTIAEGLFAANDRPAPPASLLFRLLTGLPKPADLPSRLVGWFEGTAVERHDAGMQLLDFAIRELSGRSRT